MIDSTVLIASFLNNVLFQKNMIELKFEFKNMNVIDHAVYAPCSHCSVCKFNGPTAEGSQQKMKQNTAIKQDFPRLIF